MPPGNENSASLEGQNALRVKVGELLGWTPAKSTGFVVHGWKSPDGKQFCTLGQLPNWPKDLNACAEFEKGLTENQRYDYIALVLGKSWGDVWTSADAFNLCHATAEQRCRAFIAVMEGTK